MRALLEDLVATKSLNNKSDLVSCQVGQFNQVLGRLNSSGPCEGFTRGLGCPKSHSKMKVNRRVVKLANLTKCKGGSIPGDQVRALLED